MLLLIRPSLTLSLQLTAANQMLHLDFVIEIHLHFYRWMETKTTVTSRPTLDPRYGEFPNRPYS